MRLSALFLVGPEPTRYALASATCSGPTLADPFSDLQVFDVFGAAFFGNSYLGGGLAGLFLWVSGCLAA